MTPLVVMYFVSVILFLSEKVLLKKSFECFMLESLRVNVTSRLIGDFMNCFYVLGSHEAVVSWPHILARLCSLINSRLASRLNFLQEGLFKSA